MFLNLASGILKTISVPIPDSFALSKDTLPVFKLQTFSMRSNCSANRVKANPPSAGVIFLLSDIFSIKDNLKKSRRVLCQDLELSGNWTYNDLWAGLEPAIRRMPQQPRSLQFRVRFRPGMPPDFLIILRREREHLRQVWNRVKRQAGIC